MTARMQAWSAWEPSLAGTSPEEPCNRECCLRHHLKVCVVGVFRRALPRRPIVYPFFLLDAGPRGWRHLRLGLWPLARSSPARRPRRNRRVGAPLELGFERPHVRIRTLGDEGRDLEQALAEVHLRLFDVLVEGFEGPVRRGLEVRDERVEEERFVRSGGADRLARSVGRAFALVRCVLKRGRRQQDDQPRAESKVRSVVLTANVAARALMPPTPTPLASRFAVASSTSSRLSVRFGSAAFRCRSRMMRAYAAEAAGVEITGVKEHSCATVPSKDVTPVGSGLGQ